MRSGRVKLTPAHLEALQELGRSTARGSAEANDLAAAGLAQVGEGRYGTWARITEAGRLRLASGQPPAGVPGAAQAGYLLREATARVHTNVATHARVPAATSPPAAVQDVGATSNFGRRRESKTPRRKVVGKVVNSVSATAPHDHTRAPERALASDDHPYIAPRTRRGP